MRLFFLPPPALDSWEKSHYSQQDPRIFRTNPHAGSFFFWPASSSKSILYCLFSISLPFSFSLLYYPLFLPPSPSLTLARIPLAQGTLLYRPNPEATQLKRHGGIKGPSSPQLYGGKSPPNPSLYLNKSPSALIHLRFENKKEKEEEKKKRAKRG